MARLLIIYYSRTGNTRKMAEAIAEGAKTFEVTEVILREVEKAMNRDLTEADGIIIGSPTYFRLPAWPLKKFIDESIAVYRRLKGKKGGVFASTGSRKGWEICLQALRDMLEEHGIKVVGGGVIAVGRPGAKDIKACREYGIAVAEQL